MDQKWSIRLAQKVSKVINGSKFSTSSDYDENQLNVIRAATQALHVINTTSIRVPNYCLGKKTPVSCLF